MLSNIIEKKKVLKVEKYKSKYSIASIAGHCPSTGDHMIFTLSLKSRKK